MFPYERLLFCGRRILGYHFPNELFKTGGGRPTKLVACPGRVPQQGFDFCGAEVARID